MSLIDTTYFVRDINLAAGTYNTITASITRYENEILDQLIGYDLRKLVAAYANPGSAQRIIDLVEGKEYLEGIYTVKWNGLKNSDKVSLLAYYVYIQYVNDHIVDFQNVGGMASVSENAVNGGAGKLIQSASASLHRLSGFPGQSIYEPSLYNFLSKHTTDYPEWLFNEHKLVNDFGI